MDRKVIGTLVAAVVLAAGGCGGESKPLSRAEFVKRADAACRRINNQAMNSRRGPQGIEGLAMRIMTADTQIKEELEGLTPPKNLQNRLDQYQQALENRNAYIKKVLPLIKARKFESSRSAQQQGQEITQRQATLARQLGLKNCG